MLIDWLTLRFPLSPFLGAELHQRVMASLGRMVKVGASGEVIWEKAHLDWDDLRSDSSGLFWSITSDADSTPYLTIGASPSSIVNHGVNVFGSIDMCEAATILIEHAGKALGAILPHYKLWQCRRCDVTANYDLGNSFQVKQALSLLLRTDAPRRRTNSDRKGGDSVYWNPSSDLQAGKAYHKGAHLRYQQRRGAIEIDEPTMLLADRLLRLELKLGARWFRRLKATWYELVEAMWRYTTWEHSCNFSNNTPRQKVRPSPRIEHGP
jgi:II/X family phage/plasmid replication protein